MSAWYYSGTFYTKMQTYGICAGKKKIEAYKLYMLYYISKTKEEG